MIELGGVTSALVGLSLDAAMLRQQVIANNIANAQTPGYVPKGVEFEALFTEARALLPGPEGDRALWAELEAAQGLVRGGETIHARDAAEVELDVEMMRLTENVIRFRALLAANGKRMDMVRMAVNEGRGT